MGAPANQQSKPRNQVYVDTDGSMYYYRQPTVETLTEEAQKRNANPMLYILGNYPEDTLRVNINSPMQTTERFKSSYTAPQPKSISDLFPSLGLNFNAPRNAVQATQAPQSTLDVNSVLGLSPSQYSGLQSVGDTGYYYNNNRVYEPYTVTSTPSYGIMGMYGMGGGSNRAEGTIEVGNQAFRPVNKDITGFSKSKVGDTGIYEYTPSMAYVYANTPRQAPVPTQNTMSFLSSPLQLAEQTNSYGAGRFLNNGLIPLNFGSPNDTTGSDS